MTIFYVNAHQLTTLWRTLVYFKGWSIEPKNHLVSQLHG